MRTACLTCLICFVAATVSVTAPAAALGQPTEAEPVIGAAYDGLLGRSADPDGLSYWTGLVDAGARLGDAIALIGDSVEHRRHVVQQRYERILQRPPEPAGLDYWSDAIIDRLSAASLTTEIFSSDEFYLTSGATSRGYVNALYQRILGRDAEPAGLEYWSGLLDRGATRRAVAREIQRSLEGILQPELSIVSARPAPGGVGSVATIMVDLDRAVVPEASAIIVSAGGRRVPGSVNGDTNDPNRLVFDAEAEPQVAAGSPVVVTVFATSEVTPSQYRVDAADYTFTFNGGLRSDPDGELIVAFYGHPGAPVLGVAGEGTPEQALTRLLAQSDPYRVTGRPVVPAFELIATLVTASPGADGLYRKRATETELRTYLDMIRTVGGRLILDIQPGRADVLDEARAFEPLLLEPDVGLALDPEWVVGPTQTPRGRIGSLDAAAINRVSAYLADLVAANDLPPKLLIIHRFREDMVTNVDQIVSRPDIRILFQADGEGGPAAKILDYDNLLPEVFERGIKIFYDEDTPTMAPSEVLARTDPDPHYVSYQ